MSSEGLVTPPSMPGTEASASPRPPRQSLMKTIAMKLFLYLGYFALFAATFLILDGLYTMVKRGKQIVGVTEGACRTPDPILQHAIKPNCATVAGWGGRLHQFFSNSLGFRDEKIREVPLADPRPRLLMLGDSMTEGMLAWSDSFVGKIAAHFPQYDVLNGGVVSYSPSNYLNRTRILLRKGFAIDEVVVFIDPSDVNDEAAFYRDVDASGAVTGPQQQRWIHPWYEKWSKLVDQHFLLTSHLIQLVERSLIAGGRYKGTFTQPVNIFDMERAAWTYRPVNETDPWPAGYAPLGVEGGIAKEKAKMTLLWQDLKARNIPLSVVVYPHPAEVVHDTVDSREVTIWRDWCEGKCKRFITLFPEFFAVKDQCPPREPGCWYLNLFIFGDNHMGPGGNALVANVVIQSLTEQPPAKVAGISASRDDSPSGNHRQP